MFIFIIIVATLVIGWLVTELNGRPGIRLGLGLACIATLTLMFLAQSHSRVLVEAEQIASMRLLGEALEKGDIEMARAAVAAYNQQGAEGLPASRMMAVLSQKK